MAWFDGHKEFLGKSCSVIWLYLVTYDDTLFKDLTSVCLLYLLTV